MTGRCLDIDELADYLGVTPRWVLDKVTARAIPHHRFGKHVRFTADDVAAIEAAAEQPVEGAPATTDSIRARMGSRRSRAA